MYKVLRLLDTPSGHIVVLLFLVVLGLLAMKLQVPRAEEIMIGALAALWPLLRKGASSASSASEDQKDKDRINAN
jgi:hypothetical protein